MNLKSWDILTFKLQPILKFECKNDHWLNFYPPPIENEDEKNHVSDIHGCVTVIHTGSGENLKTLWITSAPWMRDAWEKIRAEEKGKTNVPSLEAEAADLRAKIAEVERLRGLARKEIELEAIIKTASDEMDRICSQGYSARLDSVLAKKQESIDALHRELRNIREERCRAIIPATWRWEERLAEIEKELGQT
jgi:hypothetical protein